MCERISTHSPKRGNSNSLVSFTVLVVNCFSNRLSAPESFIHSFIHAFTHSFTHYSYLLCAKHCVKKQTSSYFKCVLFILIFGHTLQHVESQFPTRVSTHIPCIRSGGGSQPQDLQGSPLEFVLLHIFDHPPWHFLFSFPFSSQPLEGPPLAECTLENDSSLQSMPSWPSPSFPEPLVAPNP